MMRSFIVALFVWLICLPGSLPAGTEGDPTAGPEDVDEFVEAELSLNQEERREELRGATVLAVDLGDTLPWQRLGLAMIRLEEAWLGWTISAGGGRFRTTGQLAGGAWQATVESRTLGGGGRWYPTGLTPVYLEGGAGLVSWNGVLTLNEGSGRWHYNSHGINIYMSPGFSFVFESGLFLEYSVFRISRAWMLENSLTGKDKAAGSGLADELQRSYSWSFLNLRLGWVF